MIAPRSFAFFRGHLSSASSVPLCFKDFGFGAFAQFSDPRSSVFINGKGYR
jgi:hypothetical protein